MKLVEDPVLCHSIPVSNTDSKPFQHHDGNLEGDSWKAGNKLSKEDDNGFLCDLKSLKKNVDPLPVKMSDGYRLCEALHRDSSALDGLTNGKKQEDKDPVMNVAEGNSKCLFTDKSIMECELPKLVVCYKENDDHVVKDICIDEGVSLLDRILLENGKDQQGQCTFSHAEDDNGSLTHGKTDFELPVPDGLKSFGENSCDEDVNIVNPKEMIQKDATEKMTGDVSDQKVVLKDILLLGNLNPDEELYKEGVNRTDATGKTEADSSEEKIVPEDVHSVENMEPVELIQEGEENTTATEMSACEASKQKIVPEDMHLVENSATDNNCYKSCNSDALEDDRASREDEQHANKMLSEEAILESSAPDSTALDSTSCMAKLSYDSNVEGGSITFNFDSCAPASSIEVDKPQNVDCEQPHDKTIASRPENVVSDNPSASARLQHDHGETSFASVPFSGLITYSGPIAYSGSLSLRSDGSATSTRSFAFPVLQSEFSSPVRMAKADRRRFRKHGGWRQGLLCCRF